MKTSYFTFGQTHVHSVGGRTFDKDDIVKITSDTPRFRMMHLFGPKWAMEYTEDDLPELLKYHPKGITDLST